MKKNRHLKLNINQEGHLSDLQINETGVVLALHNHEPALRRRLLDMGITKNVEITIEGKAPLGDPIRVLLRGYSLAIRLSDMREIDVRRIK